MRVGIVSFTKVWWPNASLTHIHGNYVPLTKSSSVGSSTAGLTPGKQQLLKHQGANWASAESGKSVARPPKFARRQLVRRPGVQRFLLPRYKRMTEAPLFLTWP